MTCKEVTTFGDMKGTAKFFSRTSAYGLIPNFISLVVNLYCPEIQEPLTIFTFVPGSVGHRGSRYQIAVGNREGIVTDVQIVSSYGLIPYFIALAINFDYPIISVALAIFAFIPRGIRCRIAGQQIAAIGGDNGILRNVRFTSSYSFIPK